MTAAVTFAMLVLAYSLVARALGRTHVSASLAFVAAGSVLGLAGGARTAEEVMWIRAVADLTLALILFHDAAQVRPRDLRAVGPIVSRMLLVAWPLTLLAGFLVARVLYPDQPVMLALLLAAALAPTDAGLSAATLVNPAVPVRVRAMLNVESGLNDGLATPVVLFAIASLAGAESLRAGASAAEALGEIALGTLVGAGVGAGGGLLLGWSRARSLSTPPARALAVAALPVLSFGAAELAHANGFVSAFVSGGAFAVASRWLREEESVFGLTEAGSELLGFGVWLVFGIVVVPQLWDQLAWVDVAYAVLSLTVLRMVPVALSLLGSGLRPPTVLFLGWFGPRGLASVIFALLAIETLEVDDDLRHALLAVSLTVLLSVVAHGFSADPLARRYGAWAATHAPPVETGAAREPKPRGSRVRDPGRTLGG